MHDSLVVSMSAEKLGVQFQMMAERSTHFMAEFEFEISAPLAPLTNLGINCVHCQWEDEVVRERTDHLHWCMPSSGKSKTEKLTGVANTSHAHGCCSWVWL